MFWQPRSWTWYVAVLVPQKGGLTAWIPLFIHSSQHVTFRPSTSDIALIERNSLHKDDYVSLLETRLAEARYRILMLEAKCAMLGDTGEDVCPLTPPASPPPCLPLYHLCRHSSTFMRPFRRTRHSEMCLHGQKATRAVLSPEVPMPRKCTSCLKFFHRRSGSLTDEPTPCPIDKPMPSAVSFLPLPTARPSTAKLRLRSDPPPTGRTPRFSSTVRLARHESTRSIFTCEGTTSGSHLQPRPARRRTEESPQATSICTAPTMRHLRSRRRYSSRQSLTSN